MKRIVIILLLVISLIWGYGIIVKGFSIDAIGLTVYSYDEIGEQSEDLTLDIAAYNKKNNTEFNEILSDLDDAIDEYKDAKEEYESIIEELSTSESSDEIIVSSSFPVYEIDFLWATIGGYAKKEGLVITMDVNQNTAVSDTLGYDLYNLNFVVSGEYISIADFLYDIEDDDQLGFEIRDYTMEADIEVDDGEETIVGTIATFTIYNVPLNSATLIETTEETTEESEEDEDSEDNSTNTSSSNSTNTTNSTNSTNTTNSTKNSTNNTTN